MPWSWQAVVDSWPVLLHGFRLTVIATVGASIIAMLVGFGFALTQVLRISVLWRIVYGFAEFVRRTPLLVQLYFVFYVFPLYGMTWSPMTVGIVVLGVYNASYVSIVIQAALDSVPRAQIEAAKALNLPRRVLWRDILVAQALPVAVPPLGNYIIVMFKESSLLSTITISELLFSAMNYGSLTYRYVEPLTIAGMLYLAVSYVASLGIKWLERRTRQA